MSSVEIISDNISLRLKITVTEYLTDDIVEVFNSSYVILKMISSKS